MAKTIKTEASQNQGSAMTFTFQGTPTGRFELRFADVALEGAHMRLAFEAGRAIEDILDSSLVTVLRGIVARVQGEAGTLVVPELDVSLPRAVLRYCTVIVSRLRSGVEQIVIRFREAAGAVLDVFRDNYTGVPRQNEIIEGLKNTILYSLYLPLVNIRGKIEELQRSFSSETPDVLDRRISEVREDVARLNVKCEKTILPKLQDGREI